MASPSQALVLRFNTDLGKAQNNISQFAAKAYLDFEKVNSYAKTARLGLDALGQASSALKIGAVIGVSAIAGILALRAVVDAAHAAEEALGQLNAIAAGAAKAGVGTTFFQSWTKQAKELNLETSDLVGILQKAREAVTDTIGENGSGPKNPIRDQIRRNILAGNLGEHALSQFNAADTVEARIRVVLDLIDQLKQKSAQLAAFDLAKTLGGQELETQLRNGVDLVGKMRAAADGLQVAGGERIIPPEEIQRAARMKEELDEINNRLAQAAGPILADIAHWQQNMLEYTIEWKKEWAGIVELINGAWPIIKGIAEASAAMLAGAASLGFSAELDITRARRPEEELPAQEAPALTVRRDTSRPLPSLTQKAASVFRHGGKDRSSREPTSRACRSSRRPSRLRRKRSASATRPSKRPSTSLRRKRPHASAARP